VLLTLIVRRRWRSRRLGPPSAVLYLFDEETREARTIMVQQDAALAIRRRPLSAVPITPLAPADGAIAQIVPTAQGPALVRSATPDAAPVLLRSDQPYVLDGAAVSLRYRGQNAEQQRGRARSRGAGR
jgi:hypothetical protein